MEPEQKLHGDLSSDLKASVGARRELGPELEDQVLEAFLARVQGQIDVRVAQQVAGSRPVKLPPSGPLSRLSSSPVTLATGSALPWSCWP